MKDKANKAKSEVTIYWQIAQVLAEGYGAFVLYNQAIATAWPIPRGLNALGCAVLTVVALNALHKAFKK